MRLLALLILVITGLSWWSYSATDEQSPAIPKMNGVSLVSPHQQMTGGEMERLKVIHADWVAIIPYAFGRSGIPTITFNHDRQWWGERSEGTCELIHMAREAGMKIMLKPHVWVRGENWPGDFNLEREQEWRQWEDDYTKYILHFARVADSLEVEMFCIGTEYRIPANERPEFWIGLVKQVRSVYRGKLTYAANWDDYHQITWWDQLDFIGIDAYFPLCEKEHPTVETIKEGWNSVKRELASFAEKWDKRILFTEYGFQSIDGAAGKHWEAERAAEYANNQLQADAYEATFQALRDQEWYAGGFFWKWYFYQRSGDRYLTDWTPQGKPAEGVIARWYGLNETKR